MKGWLCLVLFITFATITVLPSASESDANTTEQAYYVAQLDERKFELYNEVINSPSFGTKDYTMTFGDEVLMAFPTEAQAKSTMEHIVADVLIAAYFTNPMHPLLWNYTIKDIEIDMVIKEMEIVTESGIKVYYVVKKISFNLSSPADIDSKSIVELNKALDSFPVNGKTDAEKVRSIITELNKIEKIQDTEPRSNIYSAIMEKRSSSAGIALAFYQLCLMNGIETLIVPGHNIAAEKEDLSFWNYVKLNGDHDGLPYESWYIVDAAFCSSVGIAGKQTLINVGGNVYSMAALLCPDFQKSTLTIPLPDPKSYVDITYDINNLEIENGSITLTEDFVKRAVVHSVDIGFKSNIGRIALSSQILSRLTNYDGDLNLRLKISEPDELTEKQRAVIGNNFCISLSLNKGSELVHKLGSNAVVEIEFEPIKGKDMSKTIVQYVDSKGMTDDMSTSYENNKVIFVTDHLSEYMVVVKNENTDFNNLTPILIAVIIGIIMISIIGFLVKKRI